MCVCFGRASYTASIPAPQASFMVQFQVIAWGFRRGGIIMVSCSAFYGVYIMSVVSVHQEIMVDRTEIVVHTQE